MKVTVVPGKQLDAEQVAIWSRLQEGDASLRSPFFRPEFTEAVAAVRNDVHVGILEDAGSTCGFFPFQRGRIAVGAPVGGRRSNYHGVVAHPAAEWSAEWLIRACGLRIWDFHHLIASQDQFTHFHAKQSDSFQVDLSAGFQAYAVNRRAVGSRLIPRMREKARRLEREMGPLRLEPQVKDAEALKSMMRWKSDQYRRTGQVDNFRIAWNVRLLERLQSVRSQGFSGMLAGLYAGDRLVAVDMGLRSRKVFHSWFPAYDPELARYSPGLVLFFHLIQAAESLGIAEIDLGRDDALYKQRMATGATAVAEGSAAVPSALSVARRTRRVAEAAVLRTPLARPARAALRHTRLVIQRGSRV
jgi:CelD/BcsL family acetyltransferase involved in cellulose biosynthesis